MKYHHASQNTAHHTDSRTTGTQAAASPKMSRRNLVRGAAWSTPAILASSTVPAWAASPEPHCSPALSLKPVATGYDDAKGAYSEWIVPQGTGRVRFDLVGGAGGATSSFTPAYLARETDSYLIGGGAGAQLSGILKVSEGDILRVWAGNGGVGAPSGTHPALGGDGYAAGGDSTGSSTQVGAAQTPASTSGIVYGASGGGSSAIELVHNGTVTVVAVAGAGGGGAQFATLASYTTVFEKAPNDQLNPAMRIAADGAGTAISGGNAGADASQDNDGQGGMLMARPYQAIHPINTWDQDIDLRISVTGGTQGRAGVPGTTGEALLGILGADRQLTFKDMTTPWFENIEFPPYYSYDGDSIITGIKGTGGSDATSGYKGRGGSGALLTHEQDKFTLTSIASGGGAGYGGGGAALNLWTTASYFEDVFGRQVQFSEGENITSITAISGGGGAGGSYINHELVSDFSLSTAKNATPRVGVRSPGSVQLYTCSENASLASPITGEAA